MLQKGPLLMFLHCVYSYEVYVYSLPIQWCCFVLLGQTIRLPRFILTTLMLLLVASKVISTLSPPLLILPKKTDGSGVLIAVVVRVSASYLTQSTVNFDK